MSNPSSPRNQDKAERKHKRDPKQTAQQQQAKADTTPSTQHINKTTQKQTEARRQRTPARRPTDSKSQPATQGPDRWDNSTSRFRFTLETKTSNQQLQQNKLVQPKEKNMTITNGSTKQLMQWSVSGSRPIGSRFNPVFSLRSQTG